MDSVLPPDVSTRLAVVQAAAMGWDRYIGIGQDAKAIVMHTFGASAPLSDLKRNSALRPEAVYAEAKKLVK